MKFLTTSIVLLLLSGCAQNSKVAKLDASNWTELKCSGFLTWHECRQEARALCPNGFYMADQLENVKIQRREVSIACKS